MENGNGVQQGKYDEKERTNEVVGTRLWLCNGVVFVRVLAIATTLVATLVMALDEETQTVYVQLVSTLPPLPIRATAKASHSSAVVYFIVANTITVCFSAISLGVTLVAKRSSKIKTLIVPALAILDLMMVALLFSGNGAAIAIGMVAEHGNSHVGWNKICGIYGTFCLHAKVSIANSLFGSLIYVVLVIISIISLYKMQSKL